MGLGKIIRVPSVAERASVFHAFVLAQSWRKAHHLENCYEILKRLFNRGIMKRRRCLCMNSLSAVEQSDAERVVRIVQDVRLSSTVLIELERLVKPQYC